ncbi:MAG TPA: hypothetical protein PL182_01780 [Pseudobdellovibrionaceae bacterium]|nr:hypothetical protein [Pseudobdellovibrionaceae bacterium]
MTRYFLGAALFGIGLFIGQRQEVLPHESPDPRQIQIERRSPAALTKEASEKTRSSQGPLQATPVSFEERMRTLLAQVPSYLVREEASNRMFGSLVAMDERYPKKFSYIQSEFLREKWTQYLQASERKNRSLGHFQIGEFRYEVEGNSIQAQVIVSYDEVSSDGLRSCREIMLGLLGSTGNWQSFYGECDFYSLRWQKDSAMFDFDVESGSSQNFGRRVLVSVPLASSENKALVITSRPAAEALSVYWRSLEGEGGEREVRRIEESMGIHRAPILSLVSE